MSFPLFLCDIIGSGKIYLKIFNKPRSNIFEIFIVILINEQSSVHLDPEKIIDQLNNTVNVSAETNPERIFQKQDVRLLRFKRGLGRNGPLKHGVTHFSHDKQSSELLRVHLCKRCRYF